MTPLGWVAVVAVVVWGVGRLLRANEVFLLAVRGRQVLLIRGGLTRPVQQALVEVLRASSVPVASVRGVRRDGATVLSLRGLDADTGQRLRNVFAAMGGNRISLSIPPMTAKTSRNWGQRLGWLWLAFHLDSRAQPTLRQVK